MVPDISEKRILVVEDEYFQADDIRRSLTLAGALVVGPVPHVQGALDRLNEETPHAAVLDINLNGSKTFEVAERLDAMDVPYLFLTGYDPWSIPHHLQAAPRLTKPARETEIVETLDHLMKGADR